MSSMSVAIVELSVRWGRCRHSSASKCLYTVNTWAVSVVTVSVFFLCKTTDWI